MINQIEENQKKFDLPGSPQLPEFESIDKGFIFYDQIQILKKRILMDKVANQFISLRAGTTCYDSKSATIK